MNKARNIFVNLNTCFHQITVLILRKQPYSFFVGDSGKYLTCFSNKFFYAL